jgi:malate dehydrogenase (quinone)
LKEPVNVKLSKKIKKEGGILEFGTEVITTADHYLFYLASPGASTAVSIMIDVVGRCFKEVSFT